MLSTNNKLATFYPMNSSGTVTYMPMAVIYDQEDTGDVIMMESPTTHTHSLQTTTVHFDNIIQTIVKKISLSECSYVIGVMAWFSNKRIINTLCELKGVCMISMSSGISKSHTMQQLYSKLPGMCGKAGVQLIDPIKEGQQQHIVHHKFLIGLSSSMEPIWLINGSCNLTEHSVYNRENIQINTDPTVICAYYDEFKRMLTLSYPLISTPNFRI